MNAEQLHVIAQALRDELDSTESPPRLQRLIQAFEAMGQQPGQPAPQQQVAAVRDELDVALREAPSNEFSPAWREAVSELGVSDLLGVRLLDQIEAVFSRNELTPAAASQELSPIGDRLNRLDNALNQLLQSFDFFDIGSNELAGGEFEIGFLIPRPAVHDGLGELGTELLKLKQILGPFLEVTTGSREDPRIRTVSSSNFLMLLHSTPATGLLLATTVERLISAYEKVMNIRVAKNQLAEAGVGEDTIKAVQGEAEGMMATEITAAVEDILSRYSELEKDRINELRKDFEYALNGIANRLDQGYTVEVHAGELPEAEEAPGDDEVDAATRDATKTVIDLRDRLAFTNLSGTPILQLPEGEGPEPGGNTEEDGSGPDMTGKRPRRGQSSAA